MPQSLNPARQVGHTAGLPLPDAQARHTVIEWLHLLEQQFNPDMWWDGLDQYLRTRKPVRAVIRTEEV